jgi:hypothetical protein
VAKRRRGRMKEGRRFRIQIVIAAAGITDTPAVVLLADYAKRSGMIEPIFAETNSTAAATAFNAAADPPRDQNGA